MPAVACSNAACASSRTEAMAGPRSAKGADGWTLAPSRGKASREADALGSAAQSDSAAHCACDTKAELQWLQWLQRCTGQ
jgi:hypothetical protein